MKESGEDEIGIIFLKCDFYDSFSSILGCDHSQIILLYTSHNIQVYFTLNFFTKYIMVFKIRMDN